MFSAFILICKIQLCVGCETPSMTTPYYRRRPANTELGHLLTCSSIRLLEASLIFFPGFFWLLVCVNRIILLSKVSILPLFPGHAILFDQKFPSRRIFYFVFFFLKIPDILLLLKCKKSVFFVFCFAWSI